MPASGPSGDPATSSLLELVATCLERMEREGEAALEALCREHPEHSQQLRDRIARLGVFGLTRAQPSDDIPERIGAFRLLARLGGGGMGVVYAAEQDGLQRRVALKLVRPGAQLFGAARERFRREVEVLARLQHPGIVPVYAGGEEQGVPYLAMELVRGATLEEALHQLSAPRDPSKLHGSQLAAAVGSVVARRDLLTAGTSADATTARAPTSAPGAGRSSSSAGAGSASIFNGNWVLTCLRIARAVADALQHAHEQGVLHRDIKPSNIMLTPDGRVLLLDFGLASAEGSARLTGSGQPLGSPAYMSPEQVRGDRGAVDARADVWSLGVTLYELLTLHQPFASESLQATSQLVLAAHPPSVRQLNPAVPRDLETVLLAAMESDPQRRYAGPAQLLSDLDCVLELRPVSVRPPDLPLRLMRWTQRRPALAVACVLGALLAIAGPLGWELQRRESLQQVSDARDRSERDFQSALSAIGYVLRDVATEELEDVPRAQRARLVAIDRALSLFHQFERDRPDDPAVLTERAALHRARGDVLRDLGRSAEALPEFEQLVLLRRRLLDDATPPSTDALHQLSMATARKAKTLFALGRPGEAATVYVEAVAQLAAALEHRSGDPELSSDLALLLSEQAESQRELGAFAGGHAALERARALLEAVLQLRPGEAEALSRLGRINSEMVGLLRAEGRRQETLPWARQALLSYEAARAAEPGLRFHVYDVADAHLAVARCFLDLRRYDECEDRLRVGLALMDELLRDYPDVGRYHDLRGRMAVSLSVSNGKRGNSQAVRADFEARLQEQEAALAQEPDRRDLALACAQAVVNLSSARLDAGEDHELILELISRGEQHLEFVRSADESYALVGLFAGVLRYNRGRAFCSADRLGEARSVVEAFEADAGNDVLRLRYSADLWNELILSMRRTRAAAEAPGSDATALADAAAEAEALLHMYDLLGRAIDAGYDDLDELNSTPSLDSFRQESAFQSLLARVSAPPSDPD